MKEKIPFWRQGDVGIIRVSSIPANAKLIKHDGVLAYGEVTGHKHQLVGGRVKYFRDDERPDRLYFKVESRFSSLNHGKGSVPTEKREDDPKAKEEGHFTHKLPEGEYALIPQTGFDWTTETLQPVED